MKSQASAWRILEERVISCLTHKIQAGMQLNPLLHEPVRALSSGICIQWMRCLPKD